MARGKRRTRDANGGDEDTDFNPSLEPRGRRQIILDGDQPFSYRGVTHHIRTNRYEAHLWENGKQMYLGGYDTPQQAALAFDIAAVCYRGNRAFDTNFDTRWYEPFLASLRCHAPEEVVAGLRRNSKGDSVQSSMFKGVTRHQKGRWEARIGQTAGKKYKYLGLHCSEIEAAKAYDLAAIERTGVGAVTNFNIVCYMDNLSQEKISEALEKGIITHADIQMELALRSTGGMNQEDVAAFSSPGPPLPPISPPPQLNQLDMPHYDLLSSLPDNNSNNDGTVSMEIETIGASHRLLLNKSTSEDTFTDLMYDTLISPHSVLNPPTHRDTVDPSEERCFKKFKSAGGGDMNIFKSPEILLFEAASGCMSSDTFDFDQSLFMC